MAVVSGALKYQVGSLWAKTTTVIAAQIPERWLPVIPGVRFTRLAEEAERELFDKQSGSLLVVHEIRKRTADAVEISIAERRKCQYSGLDMRFTRSKNSWRLDGGPGGSGAVTSCACK